MKDFTIVKGLDFGAHRKLRKPKRQLLDIPAWPVRQNNFTGLAKFHSQH